MQIFYTPEMSADTSSYSRSASKPRRVVEHWQRLGLPIHITPFLPASYSDFTLAHDADFVQGIFSLQEPNGFGNTDAAVAESLPWTVGSLMRAAQAAVRQQTTTCSPTSGFHHAGLAHAGGYCTFNGLAITAFKLQKSGEVKTVGILDCDAHYGDGTHEILSHFRPQGIKHHTFGKYFHDRDDVGPDTEHFYGWLDRAIADLQDVDLVIYQAGADPHMADPLGGILTTAEMQERDRRVATAFKGKALVWNLAGGYQKPREVPGKDGQVITIDPVLDLHTTTLREFLQA